MTPSRIIDGECVEEKGPKQLRSIRDCRDLDGKLGWVPWNAEDVINSPSLRMSSPSTSVSC